MDQDAFSEYQEPQGQDESQEPITEEGSPPPAGNTVHLPTDFLKGAMFKPGDEVVLKVTSVNDDGIEAEYATAPAKGEGPMSANDEIDSMQAQDDGGY